MGWFIVFIGVVGSVASIISLFIPAMSKKEKLLHAVYIFIIAVAVGFGSWEYIINKQANNLSQAAALLSKDREFNYSSEGYIQAALWFLEVNKERYPDAYQSARQIYNDWKEHPDSLGTKKIEVASEMDGIIRAIAGSNAR